MAHNYYPPEVTIPVYAIFTAIAIILTVIRLWARIAYTRHHPGPDDYLIILGVVILTTCTGLQFWNSLQGTSGDAISKEDADHRIIVSHKVNYSMIIIEKPGFAAIKLSLLFFYRRIFGVWPGFSKINYTFIGIIVVWALGFAFSDLFICGTKINLNWSLDLDLQQETCGDKGLGLLLFGVTSVVTDILVLALPFFYMSKLQMPTKKKWAAGFVFMLGFFATIAGVLRTCFLAVAWSMGRLDWNYHAPADGKTPLVLQVFNPTFWVMIEFTLGAWAANLPPLGPILRKIKIGRSVMGAYRKFSMAYGTGHSRQHSKGGTEESKESFPATTESQEHIANHYSHDIERGLPLTNASSSSESGKEGRGWPL